MSEKSTPTSILPAPLRETALVYLGGVFCGIDLADKYVVTPLLRRAGRIARRIGREGWTSFRGQRGRRRAR